MDRLLDRRVLVVAIVLALLAAIVGLQALGSATAPTQPVTNTGRLLGNAGFAYLGGLRVFAASVLWNRLEPQFDDFYQSKHLQDLTFLMPTLYLVQRLDPTFVQSYYNAAFILAMRGQWDEAFRVAREGVRNNPNSGLMRANYAQVLLLKDKKVNLAEAYKQAQAGIRPTMTYANADDEFESLGVFRTVFDLYGRKDLVQAVQGRLEQLKQAGAQANGFGATQTN